EAFARRPRVLNVEAQLRVRVADGGGAETLRVRGGQSELVSLKPPKGEGAVEIGEVRRVVPIGLAQQARAKRVLLPDRPVDVVGNLERLRLTVAVPAGAS